MEQIDTVPEEITLDHPAVQAVKLRWDREKSNARRKHDLSFEDAFNLFKDASNRLVDIAEKAGITTERTRQLYRDYFQEIFGQSGAERRRAFTQFGHLAEFKGAERKILEESPHLEFVVTKAREAGCVLEAVPYKHKSVKARVRSILVNGHLCSVHFAYTDAKIKKRLSYGRVHITTETVHSVEALICHIDVEGFPERVFVLPTNDIRQVFDLSGDKKTHSLYLPFNRPAAPQRSHPRFDYWKYENAWGLLAPKANETVSEKGVVQ